MPANSAFFARVLKSPQFDMCCRAKSGDCHLLLAWELFRCTSRPVCTSKNAWSDRSSEPTHKSFDEIPGPPTLPLLGSLLDYKWTGKYSVKDYNQALVDRHKIYGDIMKETIAGETVVHLFKPEYFKLIYDHEDKVPSIPPLQTTVQKYRAEKKMSLGLGNMNGDEWYRLRSAVQQMMMRPKQAQIFLPLSDKTAATFLEKIKCLKDKCGEVPNFYTALKKWILSSAGMVCFQTDLRFFEENETLAGKLIEANDEIFQISCELKFSLPVYKYFPTPKWQRFVKAEDFFVENAIKFTNDAIEKVKKAAASKATSTDEFQFMAYLLSRNELSYEDVLVISLSLFGDGLSTTAPTLVGQLYCLASNPHIQDKLREEINSVIPRNAPITSEMLARLSYLKACVKEGFRLFPVGTETSRITKQTIMIDGFAIPPGTHVELNQYPLLRSEKYFTNPDEYVPERWLRDGSGKDLHPFLMTPFGHGPRMCAGRRFAEQDTYLLICKLLQNFRIRFKYGEMKQVYKLLLVPDRPAQFTFIDIS